LWRGHELPPRVFVDARPLSLIVPGAIAPAVLGPVHRAWMAFRRPRHVNTRIILTALFFWS